MKTITIFLFAIFLWSGTEKISAQQTIEYGGLTWYLNYDEAKAVAKKENKPIVILFTGSDWCPPCKALKKEVLPNPLFRKEAGKVILVLADFPRRKQLSPEQTRHNRTLASLFLGRSGLPTMVAVDWRTGTVIRKITGYNFYKHDIQPHLNFIRFSIETFSK
jgi:thioredoxin-related protein